MFLNVLNIEIKFNFEIIDLKQLEYIKNILKNLIINIFYIIFYLNLDTSKRFDNIVLFDLLYKTK